MDRRKHNDGSEGNDYQRAPEEWKAHYGSEKDPVGCDSGRKVVQLKGDLLYGIEAGPVHRAGHRVPHGSCPGGDGISQKRLPVLLSGKQKRRGEGGFLNSGEKISQ